MPSWRKGSKPEATTGAKKPPRSAWCRKLLLKKIGPTRLATNGFSRKVQEAEDRGASAEELREIVGKGRAKKGIFEGEIENGMLEIGQVASQARRIEPVSEIMAGIIDEYNRLASRKQPVFA